MTLHAALVLLLTCLGPDPTVCPRAVEAGMQRPELAVYVALVSDLEARQNGQKP
jgi:hypothetical protein